MGPDACVVLSGALKDNSMMERLMLHDNPLGEVGAWHLMAAITANKNLEYIGLQGSNFISTSKLSVLLACCLLLYLFRQYFTSILFTTGNLYFVYLLLTNLLFVCLFVLIFKNKSRQKKN